MSDDMTNESPLTVYVAGAWVEKKERAEKWIARLREAGVRITYDWTVDEIPSTPVTDAELPPGERLKRAAADFDGVFNAELVWLLAPNERGASGAWTEFGVALASKAMDGTFVIASGARAERTIFTSLATATFKTDEEAFEYILKVQSGEEPRDELGPAEVADADAAPNPDKHRSRGLDCDGSDGL
jgi:hypothetical protein